jgi:predicted phage baseplate assembly protein
MSVPAPNLDDRRFQDLVDEAKRMVQQRCPEWTDHNVSDPGVTLIETFAFMVDQLLYRLNRVPDLHYLRFLELIGVRLFPPTAARGDVTFWLSAARTENVVVPAGAQVASLRTESEDPIVFTTERDLRIAACALAQLTTVAAAGGPTPGAPAAPVDRIEDLRAGTGVRCFSPTPQPGDAVHFGLTTAVPDCAVLLRIDCAAEGVGVDPRDPPWEWEAWDGEGWTACEIEQDTTGGFNRPGDVVLHVPPTHQASVLGQHGAGWLCCRVTEPVPGQAVYRESPRLSAATASTIGGTVPAVHAEIVRDEVLGISEGVPGQRFPLARRPVIAAAEPLVVEVAGGDGWHRWREVPTFAHSGPQDRHVMLDRVAGELVFGPVIREPDGGLTYYGAVPHKGAPIRIPRYLTGGGRRGNVARNVLQVQRDPVPFISTVTNRRPARGGVDGESVRDAATRGPLLLRTRDRAVTVEDYEQLAREAAPDAARVRCVPADETTDGVRILVVPAVTGARTPDFADLRPAPTLLEQISRHLEQRRCLGARISVEPPFYQGVTVVAQVQGRSRVVPEALRERAIRALYAYLDPIRGGPDGDGWPFGRPIHSGEIFAVLQQVPGVDRVEDIRLYGANPASGERGGAVQRLDLPAHALVFSYGHQVRIIGS